MSKETREGSKKEQEREGENNKYPKRKPRGALFESGDPTLARQLTDDPFGSKR